MRAFASGLGALCALLQMTPASGADAESPPTAYPIFVSADGAAFEREAGQAFAAAAGRYRLGPVETMDLPGAPKSGIRAQLDAGMALVKDLRYDDAERTLKLAVGEAASLGGAGLDRPALSDLYLHLAIAIDKADWKDVPADGLPAAHPEAATAFAQAALLAPERELYVRTFSPRARARFATALAEVKGRPRGTLAVRAPSDALVSIDGRPAAAAPVEISDLPYGDHFVLVQAPGRIAYSAVVPLAGARLDIDTPPLAPYRLPDADAVAHARRMNAAFALVAEMKPGPEPALELRLIEVASGARVDSAAVPARDAAALEATVMRMDERARKNDLLQRHGVIVAPGSTVAVAPAALRPRPERDDVFERDPRGWAERRWPLLTAVGITVATAAILGMLVALDGSK